MSQTLFQIPPRTNTVAVPPLPDSERKGLTKKEIAADHPTWCPGCGDFSVLALYFKLIDSLLSVSYSPAVSVAGRSIATVSHKSFLPIRPS